MIRWLTRTHETGEHNATRLAWYLLVVAALAAQVAALFAGDPSVSLAANVLAACAVVFTLLRLLKLALA